MTPKIPESVNEILKPLAANGTPGLCVAMALANGELSFPHLT